MGNFYDEALIALHGIWRQRALALAVGWGIAVAGWLGISLIPNSYKSEARVHVQAQSLLTDKIGISAAERAADIEALRQTLTSVETLQTVVRTTDLRRRATTDRDVMAKAQALQKAITIVAQQDNLFQIAATASEPGFSDAQNAQLAHQIVEKLVALFVDGNRRDGQQEASHSLAFLDGQIDQRSKQLADVDARRAAFETKYLSTLPGTGSVADRVGQARAQIAQLDAQLASAQGALAAVNGQMAATPAATHTAGSLVGGADGRAAAIQAQIADGQARGWTDKHPDMVVLRGQLARAQAQSSGSVARMTPGLSTPNPMYVSLQSMQAEKAAAASALASQKAQLQSAVDKVQQLQASSPEFAAEQSAVDRDYVALKTQYDKLLADREEVRLRGQVQAQTDAVRFDVIDPPSSPRVPAAPNRPLLLTLVLLAALAGGVGAAFGRGQLQPTYSTAARLEQASGLSVIGTISEVVTDRERQVRKTRLRRFAGGVGALAATWAVLMLVEFIERSLVV